MKDRDADFRAKKKAINAHFPTVYKDLLERDEQRSVATAANSSPLTKKLSSPVADTTTEISIPVGALVRASTRCGVSLCARRAAGGAGSGTSCS